MNADINMDGSNQWKYNQDNTDRAGYDDYDSYRDYGGYGGYGGYVGSGDNSDDGAIREFRGNNDPFYGKRSKYGRNRGKLGHNSADRPIRDRCYGQNRYDKPPVIGQSDNSRRGQVIHSNHGQANYHRLRDRDRGQKSHLNMKKWNDRNQIHSHSRRWNNRNRPRLHIDVCYIFMHEI